jgi:hypothetical protein
MVQAEEAELPISLAQRQLTTSRIARAVLNFQDKLLEGDANTGSLCQVPARPQADASLPHRELGTALPHVPALLERLPSPDGPGLVGCCVKPYLWSISCTAAGFSSLEAD